MSNLVAKNTMSLMNDDVFNRMHNQCGVLVKSGFLPVSVKTPEAAMAIAMKGYELGMSMMLSFSYIYVVDGKTCITAEGMNFLIRKNCPEARISIVKRDATGCILKAWRPGMDSPVEFYFSIEDAKKALLMANPAWQKYPKNMCFNRAFSDLARTIFPDCIGGLSYVPEEIESINLVVEDGEINQPLTESTALPASDCEII